MYIMVCLNSSRSATTRILKSRKSLWIVIAVPVVLAVSTSLGSSWPVVAYSRDHYHLMLCDQVIRPDATDLMYQIRSGKAGCIRDIPAVFLVHRDNIGQTDLASMLQVHTCLTRPVSSDQLRDAVIDAVAHPVVLREPDAYRVVIESPSLPALPERIWYIRSVASGRMTWSHSIR
jgi:hypothetical protein